MYILLLKRIITETKLEFILNDQQLEEIDIDRELLVFVEGLYNASFVKLYKDNEYKEFVGKVTESMSKNYSKKKKLTRIELVYLTKISKSLNQMYKERLNQEKIKLEKIKQEKLNQERIIKAYKEHLYQEK